MHQQLNHFEEINLQKTKLYISLPSICSKQNCHHSHSLLQHKNFPISQPNTHKSWNFQQERGPCKVAAAKGPNGGGDCGAGGRQRSKGDSAEIYGERVFWHMSGHRRRWRGKVFPWLRRRRHRQFWISSCIYPVLNFRVGGEQGWLRRKIAS